MHIGGLHEGPGNYIATEGDLGLTRPLFLVGTAAGAYHGYKRNKSVKWALIWGFLGGLAPIITGAVALAQGFGKPKAPRSRRNGEYGPKVMSVGSEITYKKKGHRGYNTRFVRRQTKWSYATPEDGWKQIRKHRKTAKTAKKLYSSKGK